MGWLKPAVVEIVWLDWIGVKKGVFPFSKKTHSRLCPLDCFCDWIELIIGCALRSEKKTSLGKQAFYVSAIFVGACLLLSPIRTSKNIFLILYICLYGIEPLTGFVAIHVENEMCCLLDNSEFQIFFLFLLSPKSWVKNHHKFIKVLWRSS